jgi:hypothetical protein
MAKFTLSDWKAQDKLKPDDAVACNVCSVQFTSVVLLFECVTCNAPIAMRIASARPASAGRAILAPLENARTHRNGVAQFV